MRSHQLCRFTAAMALLVLPLFVVAVTTETLGDVDEAMAGPTEPHGDFNALTGENLGDEGHDLAKRDTILARAAQQKPFTGGMPSCDDDPSWAKGKSRYKDGSGKYVGSACDKNKGSSRQCW